MLNLLIKRLLGHISSLTVVILYLVIYLSGYPDIVESYLPEKGKPLILFILLLLVGLFELYNYGYRHINCKLTRLSDQMAITSLKQAVNSIYESFNRSGDEFITNEYTIKEVYELKDLRTKYKVNSYTQGKLHYLCSKIREGVR